MTAHQQQIRSDTATNLNAAVPASGELGWDTTNKRVVVGDGSAPGGIKHASAKDVQNRTFESAIVGGTADAITLTCSPATTAYTNLQKTVFKATGTNTGPVTVNRDGIGLRSVKKMLNGVLSALSAGDIVSGGIYELDDDGTQLQLKGMGQSSEATGGLAYVGEVIASGSTEVDLESMISATYDDYVIEISNMIPASNAILLMRTSTNNGSSYDAGGSDYIFAATGNTSAGVDKKYSSTGSNQINFANDQIQNGGAGLSGSVHLYNVNNTTSFKQIVATFNYERTSNECAIQNLVATRQSTQNIDAVRFVMSSGNITSGTFRMYGKKKA